VAVFAAREQVLLAVPMPGWAGPGMARFGVLPHLLPLLEWLQSRPAHVTALVDRTGADITLFAGGAGGPTRWCVSGPDDEIERNAPGGWAQGRYQRRAEDSWEHNAVQVVDELGAGAAPARRASTGARRGFASGPVPGETPAHWDH
jgi:hypothetical protein